MSCLPRGDPAKQHQKAGSCGNVNMGWEQMRINNSDNKEQKFLAHESLQVDCKYLSV
jgi:hypothetical protein